MVKKSWCRNIFWISALDLDQCGWLWRSIPGGGRDELQVRPDLQARGGEDGGVRGGGVLCVLGQDQNCPVGPDQLQTTVVAERMK